MGRPPTPLGTAGKVLFLPQPNGRTKARVWFRDTDGTNRLVSRTAGSKAAAERAVKAALAERTRPFGDGVFPTARVDQLADEWLITGVSWSEGTRRTYATVVRNQVKPTLGQLRLTEVTPGVLTRALTAIGAKSGDGAAKTARACLSGMFSLAVNEGALLANPVRDASLRRTTARRRARALTVKETTMLIGLLRSDERALELDLPDLVDWMLFTGCRIGEALALRHRTNDDGRPLIDTDARTWEINATVIRVSGQGLRVQPRTKTAAGWRVVALPPAAVNLLADRQLRPRFVHGRRDLVFPSPLAGTVRDPSNTSGDLREVLDRLGSGDGDVTVNDGGGGRQHEDWSWVTSHTFRKTAATRLEEGGLTVRQIADQLGHANPSMTLDTYVGRQVVTKEAAAILDRPAP